MMRARTSRALVAGLLALGLALGGCASAPLGSPPADAATRAKDPLESMNRAVFGFNDALDRAVVKPVAQAYTDHVHSGVRTMIGNVFGNLGDAWSAVNQLLQGKPMLALSDLGRVLINTTIGFGGLGDPASEMGIEKHREDFGQTLGRWGVGSGPYLVLPFLGPSTIRDTAGLPLDWYGDGLQLIDRSGPYWTAYGLRAVHIRAGLLPAEKVLDGAALDKYSFIRDGYLQRRRNLVYDGNPPDDDK